MRSRARTADTEDRTGTCIAGFQPTETRSSKAISERPMSSWYNPPSTSFTPRAERTNQYEDQQQQEGGLHARGNHDRRRHHRPPGRHRDSELREGPSDRPEERLHQQPPPDRRREGTVGPRTEEEPGRLHHP